MFLGVSWQKTLAAAGAATSCWIAAFGTMTQVLRTRSRAVTAPDARVVEFVPISGQIDY